MHWLAPAMELALAAFRISASWSAGVRRWESRRSLRDCVHPVCWLPNLGQIRLQKIQPAACMPGL